MVDEGRVRIDKWLWAARFFKTRSTAAKAVSGGHVQVNGLRAKPSRLVAPGEELRIRRGEQEFTVIVNDVSDKRGPAKAAQLLYTETAESIEARERKREERRLLAVDGSHFSRVRPDRRDRRLIRKIIGKGD